MHYNHILLINYKAIGLMLKWHFETKPFSDMTEIYQILISSDYAYNYTGTMKWLHQMSRGYKLLFYSK